MALVQNSDNVNQQHGRQLFVGAFVGAALSLAIFFVSTELVTIRGTIQIGLIDSPVFCQEASDCVEDEVLIERAGELSSVLRARYRVREAKLRRLPPPYLYRVTGRSDSSLVELEVKAKSILQGEKFIQELTAWVVNRHNKIVQRKLVKIDEFHNAVREIKADLGVISRHLGSVPDLDSDDFGKSGLKDLGSVDPALRSLLLIVLNPKNLTKPTTMKTELISVGPESRTLFFLQPFWFLFSGVVVGIVSVLSLMGIREFIRQWKG
jgi:hypothetical protein